MQEGMLFHHVMDEASEAYFLQSSFVVEGDMNRDCFQESIDALVARYDVLRTVFTYKKVTSPRQVVLKERTAPVKFYDISGLDRQGMNEFIEDFLAQERKKGFNLSKDIPFRASMLKMTDQRYLLVFGMHHIVMDGWCLGIVYKELMLIYAALLSGNTPQLPPTTQYKHYIGWLGRQDHEAGLAYWRGYLAGYDRLSSPAIAAPGPRARTGQAGYRLGELDYTIGPGLSGAIRDLAREAAVTVNILFQAAWGVLLQRFNHVDDVVFGIIVSGRPAEIPGIEEMVGLFLNTVPLRIRLEGEENVLQLLERVYRKEAGSKTFEYLPIAEIQADSSLKNQLFDHLVVFENYPAEEQLRSGEGARKASVRISGMKLREQTNYDLNVVIFQGAAFQVRVTFNTLAYSSSFVKKCLRTMEHILAQAVRDPQLPLNRIDLLNPSEKQSLLDAFDATNAEYPFEKTVRGYFEETARRFADAVALEDPATSGQVTYERLDRDASRLASLLIEKGMAPGALVGLLMEPSVSMVIAVLAVLKAGGAYMPMDPRYPAGRLQFMLADSDTRFLLASSGTVQSHHLYKDRPGTLVVVDEWLSRPHEQPLKPSFPAVDPAGAAYVIYTSGTTGKPKGVIIEHRHIVRLLFNDRNLFDFDQNDVWTLFHSYCFDFSVWEMYGALLYGGKLVLIDPLVARDTVQFLGVLETRAVTVLNQTPSAFYQLIEAAFRAGPPPLNLPLRYVIFGGEALTPLKLKAWAGTYPQARLINMFGITETTVHVTYKEIGDKEILNNISNIGVPIPTLSATVVDHHMRLVPRGVPGELLVGGAGVARGYLNRVELTAGRFIPNPNPRLDVPDRVYRSGDLVRLTAGNEMEYIGRSDHQVQIRGFRVEPGEIEEKPW
jgi:gramicidin S synthase 2